MTKIKETIKEHKTLFFVEQLQLLIKSKKSHSFKCYNKIWKITVAVFISINL